MANTTVCSDVSDAVELFDNLHLKPIAKINVSVQLPQLKTPGKSISNWEVMEKVKNMVKPHVFVSLKVIKSTLEFIRLEGEVENKRVIKTLITKLDGKTIKLSGFPDILRVRAAEAKITFPTRHDWDSYFRDAKNLNEMKPGERPDTIYFRDLPTRWFTSKTDPNKEHPSEDVLKKVFETFGKIRSVDIPMLDPYRKEMTACKPGSIQTFSFGQDLTFEAYIQYQEYVGFVKAMDALRKMKLMIIGEDGKALTAAIKVEFDKTKHLSEKTIKKRKQDRERLEELEWQREEKVKRERELEERKKEEERQRLKEEENERERKRLLKLHKKETRRRVREDKRRKKHLEKKRKEEEEKMRRKLALEERKLLVAQRKLESLRILAELLNRVKIAKIKEDVARREKELEEERKKQVELENLRKLEEEKKKMEAEQRRKDKFERQERMLRNKLLKKMKAVQERQQEESREELRKKVAQTTRLKSAVVMKR